MTLRSMTTREEALRVRLSSLAKAGDREAASYRNKLVREGLSDEEWNIALTLVTSS